MIYNKLHKILWFTIVALWTYVYAITGITTMKALVIYANEPIEVVTDALTSYGIEYHEWNVANIKKKEKLTPKLYDKRPLYYMIIMDSSLEVYNKKKGIWESALTLAQWKELDEYESKNHVRRVVINNYPKPNIGKNESFTDSQTETQKIICADNDMSSKIFNEARIKRSAPLTSKGLVHSNVQKSYDETITPILYFKPTNNIIEKTIAAAVFDKGDGREVFSFFIQFRPQSITVAILNHLWITWASRGIIPGYRRILFNPQIENVFLSTRVVDEKTDRSEDFANALTDQYRATTEDFTNIMNYMKSLSQSKSLNLGSSIKIELAMNGNGILNPDSSTNKHSKRSIESNKQQFINNVNNQWKSQHDTYSTDELFNFFADVNNRKEFNWVSNTFSNDILLNSTEKEIADQVSKNIEVAIHLGLISRHLENSELWWSKGSIGTRGSLGFTDPEIVKVLNVYSIRNGLGNKLREDITNLNNTYLPWKGSYENFRVIPRDKRLSLRWATTPAQSVWLYNKFNYDKAKKEQISSASEVNWEKLIDLESDEAVLSLLNLKHDPFVFNQSNIKTNDGKSILAQWIEATINKLTQYVYWPIVSEKSDDLANYYNLRSIQEECGAHISYAHNDTHILSIEVNTSKPCKIPITVGDGIIQPEDRDISFEKIGSDPLTVWINVPGDNTSKYIKLNPPISYLNNDIPHFDGEETFEPDSGVEGDDETEEDASLNLSDPNVKHLKQLSAESKKNKHKNKKIKENMEKILNEGTFGILRRNQQNQKQEHHHRNHRHHHHHHKNHKGFKGAKVSDYLTKDGKVDILELSNNNFLVKENTAMKKSQKKMKEHFKHFNEYRINSNFPKRDEVKSAEAENKENEEEESFYFSNLINSFRNSTRKATEKINNFKKYIKESRNRLLSNSKKINNKKED